METKGLATDLQRAVQLVINKWNGNPDPRFDKMRGLRSLNIVLSAVVSDRDARLALCASLFRRDALRSTKELTAAEIVAFNALAYMKNRDGNLTYEVDPDFLDRLCQYHKEEALYANV